MNPIPDTDEQEVGDDAPDGQKDPVGHTLITVLDIIEPPGQ